MGKAIADQDLKPGMIVTLPDCPGEKYEVIAVRDNEKQLLRREDLERRRATTQEKLARMLGK